MEYRCKVTVIDKKLFSELQEQYCAVPNSGKCPCYNVGMMDCEPALSANE